MPRMTIPRAAGTRTHRRDQRGAAALVVVMLLFFVMSLAAAYTSRNLIFEQRTATNQYRSTQALEAAEAGVEWALSQLNAGRLTNTCTPSVNDSSATDRSFRERYLTVNPTSGAVTPVNELFGSGGSVNPSCVLDTSNADTTRWGWNCRCPLRDTATAALSDPGTSIAPAFLLSFSAGPRTDLITIQSNSCTRLDSNCLNFLADRGGTGDGVASVQVTLALRGAITRIPAAPLTVLGTAIGLDSSAALTLINTDGAANGVTVHTAASGLPAAGLNLVGLPGVAPAGTSVVNDATLAPVGVPGFITADRKFIQFFGMTPAAYKDQPGLPQLDCSGGCNAAAINLLALRNPGRPLWLRGTATGGPITIDAPIGVSAPVLLIAEGDVVIGSAGSVNGLIYGRNPTPTPTPAVPWTWTWTVSGAPTINGALIAEENMTINGIGSNLAVTYDPARLRALRIGQGTFVRVPGSWRDF